jgi:hypothetical protein
VELAHDAAGRRGKLVCDNFHVLRDTVLGSDCTWLSSPAFHAEEIAAGRLVQLNVPRLQVETKPNAIPGGTSLAWGDMDLISFGAFWCVPERGGRLPSPTSCAASISIALFCEVAKEQWSVVG